MGRSDGPGSRKEDTRALTVGICTQDFSKVYDWVRVLNERGLDYVLLSPDEVIERRLDVVVADGRRPRFLVKVPPIVRPLKDPVMTIDRALCVAKGVFKPRRLIMGIDPGVRTGVAILAEGTVVRTWTTMDPMSISISTRLLAVSLRPGYILIRIGNGDPTRRDRIISSFAGTDVIIEMVDERSTSVGPRRTHEEAALRIARMKGSKVSPELFIMDTKE